jgi:pre-mRNA-processing factor 6
VDDAEDNEAD